MRLTDSILARILLVLLGTVLSLCAFALTASPADDHPGVNPEQFAHTLAISSGDLLEVQVFDSPELSAKARVDEKGNITLLIGGIVRVQGLSAEAVAAAVERRLREQDVLKDPHATVLILEYATQGVTVMGEVKTPGIYPLLGSHGLLDLVAAAGGVTPNAGKAVTVTRKSDPAHPETVQLDTRPASISQSDIDIHPGDTVVVSRAGVVYVVGDVAKPGGFLIENNDRLTVLQALALAQGANRTAAQDRARLIRKTETGRQELAVPLKRILSNKSPDMPLEDGDILFVPSSGGKNVAYRGLEAAIQVATGVIVYKR